MAVCEPDSRGLVTRGEGCGSWLKKDEKSQVDVEQGSGGSDEDGGETALLRLLGVLALKCWLLAAECLGS